MSFDENYCMDKEDVLFLEVFVESFQSVLNEIAQSFENYKFKINLCRDHIYQEKKKFLLNVINNQNIFENLEFLNELRTKIVRNFNLHSKIIFFVSEFFKIRL